MAHEAEAVSAAELGDQARAIGLRALLEARGTSFELLLEMPDILGEITYEDFAELEQYLNSGDDVRRLLRAVVAAKRERRASVPNVQASESHEATGQAETGAADAQLDTSVIGFVLAYVHDRVDVNAGTGAHVDLDSALDEMKLSPGERNLAIETLARPVGGESASDGVRFATLLVKDEEAIKTAIPTFRRLAKSPNIRSVRRRTRRGLRPRSLFRVIDERETLFVLRVSKETHLPKEVVAKNALLLLTRAKTDAPRTDFTLASVTLGSTGMLRLKVSSDDASDLDPKRDLSIALSDRIALVYERQGKSAPQDVLEK